MNVEHRMRTVLIALPETGYFRIYGSTIVELGRRGWNVVLAFDRPDKRGGSQVPRGAGSSVRSLGALPEAVPAAAAFLRHAVDYLRYLEPAFAAAGYLRRRAEKALPHSLGWLVRLPVLPRSLVSLLIAGYRGAERLIPVNRTMVEFVRDAHPDLIFVSPIVTMSDSGVRQTELLKVARRLRIPVIAGVASWDHLTSKGLVRLVPDAVTVWNDVQKHEATVLHRIPPSRIRVTGAQLLDHWFDPPRPGAAAAFREAVGIAPDRDVILFVGSSRNMAPGDSEPQFVRRWLSAVRTAASAQIRNAFVIVRPHPTNTDTWRGVDLNDQSAVIYPRAYSGVPLTDEEVETFRCSLLVSSVVVGINTTAMIEAAILTRPVLTVRDAAFAHSQNETVHFGYLSDPATGCATTAAGIDEHLIQLHQVLADPTPQVAAAQRFVRAFVRPGGHDVPATRIICDAIESCAGNDGMSAIGSESGAALSTATRSPH